MNDVLAVGDYEAELDCKLVYLHGEQHKQMCKVIKEYNSVNFRSTRV